MIDSELRNRLAVALCFSRNDWACNCVDRFECYGVHNDDLEAVDVIMEDVEEAGYILVKRVPIEGTVS